MNGICVRPTSAKNLIDENISNGDDIKNKLPLLDVTGRAKGEGACIYLEDIIKEGSNYLEIYIGIRRVNATIFTIDK